MKQTRLWLFTCLAAVFLTGSLFAQAKSLTIGSAAGSKPAVIPITLTTDEAVQGFTVAVETEPSLLEITDINTPLTNAEFIAPEVHAGWATIGVVLDVETPFEGQTIPAGDTVIANLQVTPAALACGEEEITDIVLMDGLDEPPLNNTIVVEGTSITDEEGLVLNNGSFTIEGPCNTMMVGSAEGPSDETVSMNVTLDNAQPVEGYVVSIQHSEEITLDSISTDGTDAGDVGIEFMDADIYSDGGTLGVVFDFEEPFEGQTLPAGTDQSIAVLTYSREIFCIADTPEDERTKEYAVELVDGKFGPAPNELANTVVSGGMSITGDELEKIDGQVAFTAIECVAADFYAEDTEAAPGVEAKMVLSYTSENEIQALSMALTYPKELEIMDVDADGRGVLAPRNLEDTATDAIGAEYVYFNAKCTTDCDSAGELIIGIVGDVTPTDGADIVFPPSPEPDRNPVFNVFFTIPPSAQPGDEFLIEFQDGLHGAGDPTKDPAIDNLVVIDNEAVPVATHPGIIRIGGEFIRGDCSGDGEVNIADPVVTMSYLAMGMFEPSCEDACDSNDDGDIDLNDVLNTLKVLFEQRGEIPAPYPEEGFDPTPDDLTCEN